MDRERQSDDVSCCSHQYFPRGLDGIYCKAHDKWLCTYYNPVSLVQLAATAYVWDSGSRLTSDYNIPSDCKHAIRKAHNPFRSWDQFYYSSQPVSQLHHYTVTVEHEH